MPIYFWWQIHKTNDYTYLLKEKVHSKYLGKALAKRWEAIYEGYIERFGFAPEMLEIHRKRCQIAKLKVQKMITGNKIYNTEIRIEEEELEVLMKSNDAGESNFFEVKALIEEQRGIAIDHYKVTVAEFFTYIKLLKKRNKPKNTNGRG